MERSRLQPVTPERSALMAKVRQRHTGPERAVRSQLHRMGFRFRLHRRDLPGSPDIVLPRYRLAIFVHGCFWHRHAGCSRATTPKTRVEFWQEKFRRNIERDVLVQKRLEELGWTVKIIWECQTKIKDEIFELGRFCKI